ncbi:pseudouridine synthase [Candidatus Omnitrophota bacterium]
MKQPKQKTALLKLQLFLSHNGICSRRDALQHIFDGRVTVNGASVTEPSYKINPNVDVVCFNGVKIKEKSYEYVLLHKLKGYVTTLQDAHAQRTVMDLLPFHLRHLRPVGRLDKDTEGLLLLTNDGDIAFRLTHPRFSVSKSYYVQTADKVTWEQIKRLEKGVRIDGKRTAPARISSVNAKGRKTTFIMVIHEGRKRQIRRMLSAIGHTVIYLKRIKQGPLELTGVAPGRWRLLKKSEIESLKRL